MLALKEERRQRSDALVIVPAINGVSRLMGIRTNLSLTDAQVDDLLQAASKLVRNDKEFQRLLRDLGQSLQKPHEGSRR